MSFRRAWTRFNRAPRVLLPTPGHREAWHQGRPWYYVTVLELDDVAVNARRDALLEAVADVCVPFSHGSPHVTVFVHGFARPDLPMLGAAPFDLLVGGAGAFQTCVFLEVRCPELRELRAGLGSIEHRWAHYLPHVTAGRFVRAARPSDIGTRLRPFRHLPAIRASGKLCLMAVDAFREDGLLTPASQLDGLDRPLERLGGRGN